MASICCAPTELRNKNSQVSINIPSLRDLRNPAQKTKSSSLATQMTESLISYLTFVNSFPSLARQQIDCQSYQANTSNDAHNQ